MKYLPINKIAAIILNSQVAPAYFQKDLHFGQKNQSQTVAERIPLTLLLRFDTDLLCVDGECSQSPGKTKHCSHTD